MMLSRASLLGLALAMLLGVGSGAYLNYVRSFSEVSFAIPAGETASIYKDLGGDGPFNYDPSSKPLATLEGNGTTTLKWGTYDAVLKDSSQKYESPVEKFVVEQPEAHIVINPDHTAEALAKALPAARGAARAALQKRYPVAARGYSFAADGLYGAGDWYGVVIKPQNPIQDTLRVVMHKEEGSWVVAAKPGIIIGAPAHRNIPFTILSQINEL